MKRATGLFAAVRSGGRSGVGPGRPASYALVLLAVAAGYAPSLANELVWDDLIHIVDNPAVRDARWVELLARPIGSYYRPLAFASFALDLQLGGGSAQIFHATNLLLHAAVACLVLAAARALRATAGAALGAALLFALHPVHSEAVLYVSGRPDLLATLFSLSALLCHARAAGWQGSSGGRLAFPGALLCFALALLCKESAVLVPLALVAGDRLLERSSSRGAVRDLHRWAGYAAVLAGYAIWRLGLPGEALVVSLPADAATSLASALRALADYAGLLVLPLGLHLERFSSPGASFGWGAGLAWLACALLAFARGGGPVRFWLSWAAFAYLPVANLIPVYPGLPPGVVFAAEHFLYLPAVGLSAAVSLALAGRLERRLLIGLAAAVLLAWCVLLHDRARDWRNEEVLYTHTLEHAPDSARVRLNLGNLYLRRGEHRSAIRHFSAGLVSHPDDPALLSNAGLTWLALGHFGAAERALQRVSELEPDEAQSWANLAALYGTIGQTERARRSYEEALRLDPANADSRAGLRLLEGMADSTGRSRPEGSVPSPLPSPPQERPQER